MTRDDVHVIEKETPFEGHFRINRYRLRHRLYGGGWSGELSREVFERGSAASVVPYDPDLDRVVLIEQFRAGAFAAMTTAPWFDGADTPWQVETVAGIIGPGETPDGVAVREVREETGLDILDLVPACRYFVSPGGATEYVFVYVGRVDASAAGGVHGLADEGEDIRVTAVAFDEAMAWVESGRIVNAMTLVGLGWLDRHRTELRRRWQR